MKNKVRDGRLKFRILLTSVAIMCATSALAQVFNDSTFPFQSPFVHRPVYAQFLDSAYVLKGAPEGVSLISVEKNQVVFSCLKDVGISAVMTNPHNTQEALIATDSGDVFHCKLNGDSLDLQKIDLIASTGLNRVKTILFHQVRSNKVLMADESRIAIFNIEKNELKTERVVTLGKDDEFIRFAFPDNLSTDWYLVATTFGGRYRGNWETGELLSIPERALEHGFRVIKGGLRYFARGEFQDHLKIEVIGAHPTFMIQHPTDPQTYFAATIGKSPIKMSYDDQNYYNITYLSDNKILTFSIDVDRSNPDRMIFSTTRSVFFSDDQGLTWNPLEK